MNVRLFSFLYSHALAGRIYNGSKINNNNNNNVRFANKIMRRDYKIKNKNCKTK